MKTTVSEKLVNLIDKAISGEPTPPKNDPHRRIREALESGIIAEKDAPGILSVLRPRHGVPDGVWKMLGEKVPAFPTAEKRLRVLAKEWRDTFAAMNSALQVSAVQLYQNHLDAVSAAIISHQTPPEPLSLEDCTSRSKARTDARKRALLHLSLEAHQILLPIFAAAKTAAKELLAAELQGEIARAEKFGLPLDQVSENLLSIHAVDNYLTIRMTPPRHGATIEDLCLHLVKL